MNIETSRPPLIPHYQSNKDIDDSIYKLLSFYLNDVVTTTTNATTAPTIVKQRRKRPHHRNNGWLDSSSHNMDLLERNTLKNMTSLWTNDLDNNSTCSLRKKKGQRSKSVSFNESVTVISPKSLAKQEDEEDDDDEEDQFVDALEELVT